MAPLGLFLVVLTCFVLFWLALDFQWLLLDLLACFGSVYTSFLVA